MAQKKKPTGEEELLAEEKSEEPKVKAARKPRTSAKNKAKPEVVAQPSEPIMEAEKQHGPEAVKSGSPKHERGALLLGVGLLILGILLLAGRLLSIPLGGYLWPFIFIVPGALLFWTSLSTESSSAEGLSILGGILFMLGAVFLAQSVTGLWASWAYAWAIVAPTSIGISQMIFGSKKGRDSIYLSGKRLVELGLWMFLAGFVFFELVVGISGFGLSRFGLPVIPMVLIFAGLFILVRSLAKGR